MNNRKNYNSIVFLTTLSVYLGLALVGGAAPSVLGQVNTTVNDCRILQNKAAEKLQKLNFDSQAIPNYAKVLTNLIKSSQQIRSINPELQSDSTFYFFYFKASGEPKFSLDFKPILFPQNVRQELDKELELLSNLFPKKNAKNIETFHFDFDLGNTYALNTKAKILQEGNLEAQNVFIAYDSSLDFWRCETQDKLENSILKNTEISYENDQVFIVTRLPRGSIDALLARTDAQ
jgi:hypothetical protein